MDTSWYFYIPFPNLEFAPVTSCNQRVGPIISRRLCNPNQGAVDPISKTSPSSFSRRSASRSLLSRALRGVVLGSLFSFMASRFSCQVPPSEDSRTFPGFFGSYHNKTRILLGEKNGENIKNQDSWKCFPLHPRFPKETITPWHRDPPWGR